MMKIIADTNIWYYLGQNKELFESIKGEPLAPNFLNIYELSKSDNLLKNEDSSREAIRMLFKFKNGVIYEPPFIYLAKLHQKYEFDVRNTIGPWLEFSSKFAQGHSIDGLQKDTFKQEIDSIREGFSKGAKVFNDEAPILRAQITNKKKHWEKDTIQTTSEFLNYCVQETTKMECSLNGFDLNKIELLLKTLDHFFKTLEISKMKMEPNDWVDLAILAYIQPEDKFWTREKKWIRLIKEVGLENYLYQERQVMC